MKLDNIRLLVHDFDRAFRFYRDVFGFKVTFGSEGEVYASFQVGDSGTLALFKVDLMAQAIGTSFSMPGVKRPDTNVIVFSVKDVDAEYARLKSKAVFLNKPQNMPEWTIRVVHLRDPEGNLIEICGPLA